MASYYVSPVTGSGGSGTFLDPWLLGDLVSPSYVVGPALTTLVAGDTLYFFGGDYYFNTKPPPGPQQSVLLFLSNSGTLGNPITLQAYPGNFPVFYIGSGCQALFGTSKAQNGLNDLSYIRFIGLTIVSQALYPDVAPPHLNNSPQAFSMGGVGCEIGYCSCIGSDVPTSDNHECIFAFKADQFWVHHTILTGCTGAFGNSCAFKLYKCLNVLLEDNWVFGNTTGVHCKDGGQVGNGACIFVVRRNWVATNNAIGFTDYIQASAQPITGPVQGDQSTLLYYDNVIDGTAGIGGESLNSQCYNNLFRITQPNINNVFIMTQSHNNNNPTPCDNVQLWNNVVSFPSVTNCNIFFDIDDPYSSTSTIPLGYSDFNVVTTGVNATWPKFQFAGLDMTLAQAQANGFENSISQVNSLNDVYMDQTGWVLQPAFQTAGRFGDQVGPRFSISQILNSDRYGPAALSLATPNMVPGVGRTRF